METTPAVENAVTRFDARTVARRLDVVDRRVASIVGTRHAEDGRLYAILKDDDCEFGRRISAVAAECGPAAVTVSLMAPFAELVTATRPYPEGEADFLL